MKKILVSQPKPTTEKSPYYDIEREYDVKCDFRPFFKVEGLSAKEFRQQKINILDFIKLTFVFIYISIPMGLFLNLGNTNDIWLIYIISWGTDTFAYLVGVLFGKHKLCPNISPKKTIEGAIGGILGSVILLNIFNIYIFKYNPIFINLVAIFSSIIAQIGDLFASKIKREANIKDFGNLISGHGGVLDRFDSIVFLTPVIYVIFYVFGGNI